MYKILLADNEGVVLDSLIHMIYSRFGEACDIRTAKTTRYTRILARKFIPDIAVINIQMPGMHGFDVVREIRSYHMKCLFITVSSYGKQTYQAEAASLNILTHLTKPLYRERFLPAMEKAVSMVILSQKRLRKTQQIQAKLDEVIPLLEHGLISQMFFPGHADENLARYKELLNIPQNYGRVVTLTFGEKDEKEGVLQNPVGSSIRLQKEYHKFREIIREQFPLSVIGPVMGNHLLFLLPYWENTVGKKDALEFSETLQRLTDALADNFDGFSFLAAPGSVRPLTELHLSRD